jgi:hypothetical protein
LFFNHTPLLIPQQTTICKYIYNTSIHHKNQDSNSITQITQNTNHMEESNGVSAKIQILQNNVNNGENSLSLKANLNETSNVTKLTLLGKLITEKEVNHS